MSRLCSKHVVVFQETHCNEYGLKITSRDAASSKVTSVVCLFCTVFGRDSNVGAKRKRTQKLKYWSTGSFRMDNYLSHMRSQHASKWSEYQLLNSIDDRLAFFESIKVPFVNTLHAHFGNEEAGLRFWINKPIVETIIGEMFFHPDDVEGVTHTRALSIFQIADEDETNEREVYFAEIKTKKRFQLAIKLVALGDSFRSVSRQLQVIRDESGIAAYGGASDVTVSNYIRMCMAASLQKLSEILGTTWAISIAFDCSTHQSRSYLDVRVRFFYENRICNYHLIALPMFERHTGANMSDLIVKFFDALFPDWKSAIVGLSTDGDRSMTGRIRGTVTRIEQMLLPGAVRVWCGLHQLDLVMQAVFEAAFDETFLGLLTKLIGLLRRQQNLISSMRSECPKFCSVRWLSMGKVLSWLVLHRVKIQQYLLEKNLEWTPPDAW
ncbi:hypothetical protein BASA60_004062 [Batrachochytrium salamandrivorans]|nr:hypothetical protein BASA60_004062 [Batrachochytrium salamandrivorans]